MPSTIDGCYLDGCCRTKALRLTTLARLRAAGVRQLAHRPHRCLHSGSIAIDRFPDHVRLHDLTLRMVCMSCSQRGADITPGWPTRRKAA